ncbi:MAG: transglutaminase domain-containing protein, partial [Caldilineaceae bacterium]|nr:transglutaminase domain-containing protein [Caldilineaceae bacterium]
MSQQHQEPTLLPHTNPATMTNEQSAEDALLYRLAACRWENLHAHHPPLLANLPWQAPPGMGEYLQATKLCNFDHPTLCAKAAAVVAGAPTPQQAAMRIFTFVRDQIRFGLVHPMDETALMTLERGMGQCSAKSNLQVALLRAAQIPARFHVVAVDRRSLHGLVPSLIYRLFGASLWHPWAELYLDGQWRACDTLIDQPLYFSATQHGIIETEQIPTIDW